MIEKILAKFFYKTAEEKRMEGLTTATNTPSKIEEDYISVLFNSLKGFNVSERQNAKLSLGVRR